MVFADIFKVNRFCQADGASSRHLLDGLHGRRIDPLARLSDRSAAM
jgi:hypothetical protein